MAVAKITYPLLAALYVTQADPASAAAPDVTNDGSLILQVHYKDYDDYFHLTPGDLSNRLQDECKFFFYGPSQNDSAATGGAFLLARAFPIGRSNRQAFWAFGPNAALSLQRTVRLYVSECQEIVARHDHRRGRFWMRTPDGVAWEWLLTLGLGGGATALRAVDLPDAAYGLGLSVAAQIALSARWTWYDKDSRDSRRALRVGIGTLAGFGAVTFLRSQEPASAEETVSIGLVGATLQLGFDF